MQVNGGQKTALRWMSMYPTQGYQIKSVLFKSQLLFAVRSTRVGRARLFWEQQMSNGEAIPMKNPSNYCARFDVKT